MRVLIINAVPYGSTGRIMFSLADRLKNEGHEVMCTSGFTWVSSDRDDFFITSNIVEKYIHTLLARITGFNGMFSRRATKKLLKKADRFKPDIIHLHNLHGWFVNLPMLFDYIKAHRLPVVWTLHDCWAFTGHCPHYTMAGCDRWKAGCHNCPLYREYPQSFSDNSEKMYRLKKKVFAGMQDVTVVTPSEWMKGQVCQSMLKDYEVKVINNGIDIANFTPGEHKICKSADMKTILGVSYEWNRKKGVDIFCRLAEDLPANYKIVLVGTDEKTEKGLHPKITAVRRTQSQQELIELYRNADVFVNPTREDTFPTVNIEALACGTPVITFDAGGSPEIPDAFSGSVIPVDDYLRLKNEIVRVCEQEVFSVENCRKRGEVFSTERFLAGYMNLYERKINERITEETV